MIIMMLEMIIIIIIMIILLSDMRLQNVLGVFRSLGPAVTIGIESGVYLYTTTQSRNLAKFCVIFNITLKILIDISKTNYFPDNSVKYWSVIYKR